ncbi:transducin/WD40 repeat-like superfamily protein isoform X2 [Tasmannia lanceolata]|uniref:transducin/WD40 repeat-like superfamily protein isoform X2 n=1 Tax=Tasmannia lanceolata TaxID=3420 RepID=UPI004063522F
MDKYVLPRSSSPDTSKPLRSYQRHRWKRTVAELNGRFLSKQQHEISGLLLDSYSEIGAFGHCYNINGESCPTHLSQIIIDMNMDLQLPFRREGISGLEFDKKGIYLASVTKSGCLTVHDFEALYCLSNGLLSSSREDETKHLLHLTTHQQLDVVRWNLTNQDEVLEMRPTSTMHHYEANNGFSDIAFTSIDDSRLLASDLYGAIYIWDRRSSNHPCLKLTSNSRSTLNSIRLNEENRIVFGASKQGIIYAWDLRGGRNSVAFQSCKEVYHPPLSCTKLAYMLEKIPSLKAQTHVYSRGIHSIDLDPSCPHQLAFHLDDGWSGVLNIHISQVTHVHCPPPAWLNGKEVSIECSYLRKPSWLPTCSIYVVGSSSDDGIHLLDFYPDNTSACHVDFSEGVQNISEENNRRTGNRFIPLSKGVTACAAHPLNGTIIAGTKQSSLLVVSQRQQSFDNES